VRREDSKGGHGIHGQRFRKDGGQRVGEEGNTSLGLGPLGEELPTEGPVVLRYEERRSPERALSFLLRLDLVVEEFLHVFDREKVLPVHGDDDSIPELRNKDLVFVSVESLML
jgi:hypothetical protein